MTDEQLEAAARRIAPCGIESCDNTGMDIPMPRHVTETSREWDAELGGFPGHCCDLDALRAYTDEVRAEEYAARPDEAVTDAVAVYPTYLKAEPPSKLLREEGECQVVFYENEDKWQSRLVAKMEPGASYQLTVSLRKVEE